MKMCPYLAWNKCPWATKHQQVTNGLKEELSNFDSETKIFYGDRKITLDIFRWDGQISHMQEQMNIGDKGMERQRDRCRAAQK